MRVCISMHACMCMKDEEGLQLECVWTSACETLASAHAWARAQRIKATNWVILCQTPFLKASLLAKRRSSHATRLPSCRLPSHTHIRETRKHTAPRSEAERFKPPVFDSPSRVMHGLIPPDWIRLLMIQEVQLIINSIFTLTRTTTTPPSSPPHHPPPHPHTHPPTCR